MIQHVMFDVRGFRQAGHPDKKEGRISSCTTSSVLAQHSERDIYKTHRKVNIHHKFLRKKTEACHCCISVRSFKNL